jgi:hypothetical protein
MEMLWINVAQPLVNPPGDGSIRIRGSLIHLLPLLLILSALTVWLRIVFPSAGLAAAGEPALKFQTVESQAVDDILFKPGLGLYLAGGSRLGYQPPPDARALSLCNIVYFRPDWNDLESAGPASGIESTVDPQTFHSGTSSLRLTGDQRGAWNYAARSLAMPVLPGSKYRLSCWLRMDRLEPAQVVPYLKIGLTGADGRWLTNFQTNLYDMAATGTWQRLEGIVETPLETAGGHLALERGSKEARAVYGRLKNGWYGLRSLLRTLVAMALLRIKRPEQLKHHGPAELGRVLGMPRAAEVKTVRRKLFEISLLGKAAQWHRELARPLPPNGTAPRASRCKCRPGIRRRNAGRRTAPVCRAVAVRRRRRFPDSRPRPIACGRSAKRRRARFRCGKPPTATRCDWVTSGSCSPTRSS